MLVFAASNVYSLARVDVVCWMVEIDCAGFDSDVIEKLGLAFLGKSVERLSFSWC